MSNPYAAFGTDSALETNGIRLDYGGFYFDVRRAGGSNKRFAKVLEAKMRPHRRAIQAETIKDETANRIVAEAFAEAVFLGWGCDEFGEGKMPGKDGAPLDFSVENCVRLMLDLPDLFADIRQQTDKLALFKRDQAEADAKN